MTDDVIKMAKGIQQDADTILGVVRPVAAPDSSPDSPAAARAAVLAALDKVRDDLIATRIDRDKANDLIRDLVEAEETLSQAAGVFDRRERKLEDG